MDKNQYNQHKNLPGSPFSDESVSQSRCEQLVKEAELISRDIQEIERTIENYDREVTQSENSIQLLRQNMTDENRLEFEQDIQDIISGLDRYRNLVSEQTRKRDSLRNKLRSIRGEYNASRCQRFTPLRF